MVHCPVVVMWPHPAMWLGSPSFQLEYDTSSSPSQVKLRPWIKESISWESRPPVAWRHTRVTLVIKWKLSSEAHSIVVESHPGRPVQAVDQQREVRLLVGILHRGQSPIQRFTQMQSAGPVQALLHHPVRHSTQLHRLRQGGGNQSGCRREILVWRKQGSLCVNTLQVQVSSFKNTHGWGNNELRTLMPLTNVAVTLHLTGSGGPHAGALLRVPMNHHHAVSLRGDSDMIRTGTKRGQHQSISAAIGGCCCE